MTVYGDGGDDGDDDASDLLQQYLLNGQQICPLSLPCLKVKKIFISVYEIENARYLFTFDDNVYIRDRDRMFSVAQNSGTVFIRYKVWVQRRMAVLSSAVASENDVQLRVIG
ncbi:hypothetical protein TNCV_4094661 [Trichonephila clavipes]|uniref:Uncharacterized protein n=1 Tax=Trichonephila clavipes TaxID=2585209 RepID=A0A8X6SFS4_TRICX|nr:hypothetical protein TNCV_4094661 [Trichonephila clavipes]